MKLGNSKSKIKKSPLFHGVEVVPMWTAFFIGVENLTVKIQMLKVSADETEKFIEVKALERTPVDSTSIKNFVRK